MTNIATGSAKTMKMAFVAWCSFALLFNAILSLPMVQDYHSLTTEGPTMIKENNTLTSSPLITTLSKSCNSTMMNNLQRNPRRTCDTNYVYGRLCPFVRITRYFCSTFFPAQCLYNVTANPVPAKTPSKGTHQQIVYIEEAEIENQSDYEYEDEWETGYGCPELQGSIGLLAQKGMPNETDAIISALQGLCPLVCRIPRSTVEFPELEEKEENKLLPQAQVGATG
ncbi:hypothetical protein CHS0354_011053 [Potamilus streckersoni]|uniref:Uncharacterized protein n=1 Tax=Potamilus streckersoni TaxID=2493646 RepID=A0AAE0TKZ2_9BIVA|nr:hypothetical protein CHS0354_011053 [Potamilus streckersoni]